MNPYQRTDFETPLPPEIDLIGDYAVDPVNSLIGDHSLRMETNPNDAPYYFYYWNYGLPLLPGVVRLEVTAAIDTSVRCFVIGWRIMKNDALSIMVVRLNYANNKIEVVENTSPHTYRTVASPIPVQVQSDNPLRPFRISLDVNTDTLAYARVRLHDFTNTSQPNDYIYPLSLSNVSSPLEGASGMTVKINPQASLGIIGTAWMDDVTILTE
jgi:hypothetical protein